MRGFPADATDSAGLLLPDAGWPTARAAPGELEVLRRFVNTANLESGAERWRTPSDVRRWLTAEGHAVWDVTTDDIVAMVEFREFVRALAVTNHDGEAAAVAPPALLSDLRLTVDAQRSALTLSPASSGMTGLLERMAAIAVHAAADGTWPRFKACRNRVCRWAYFDHSKNRRGRWCAMATCGSRRKARAYRARQRP